MPAGLGWLDRDPFESNHPIVIAGLDPAIHIRRPPKAVSLDRRVKPGDDGKVATALVRSDLSVPLCLCGLTFSTKVTRCC
jgi:hypothetical protein